MCSFRAFRSRLGLIAGALVAALPTAANACSVCFGKTDSPLGDGFHWGVFVLLALIFAMLAGVGTFALVLGRRAAAIREADAEAGIVEENEGGAP